MISKLIPNKIKRKIVDRVINNYKSELKNTKCDYVIKYSDNKNYDGKIAIVTGGSGAIGSAISLKLAMEGAVVYVAGRDKIKCDEISNYISKRGGKAYSLIVDVTNEEDIIKKFSYVASSHGKIDILINNAGGSTREKYDYLENQSIDVIDNIINTNLRGTIICSKIAIKYMEKGKYGRIINIASTCGVNGLSKFSEYSSSKAGVIGFTKALAMELASSNITVNAVSPGVTNHIIWDKCVTPSSTKKNYTGKLGTTDDIANAVEFFCREESSFIIGQNLIVDGGRSLGLKGE